MRHIHVVNNVNASHKCNRLVHDYYFPVQTAQSLSLKRPGRCLGPELEHHHAGRLQVINHGFRQIIRTESIDQDMRLYPAKGRPPESFRDASSGMVICKNIAFQINFMNGPVQRRFQRRKIGFAVLQQGDLIVSNNGGHGTVVLLFLFEPEDRRFPFEGSWLLQHPVSVWPVPYLMKSDTLFL